MAVSASSATNRSRLLRPQAQLRDHAEQQAGLARAGRAEERQDDFRRLPGPVFQRLAAVRAVGIHLGRAEQQEGFHPRAALAAAPQDAESAGPDVMVTPGAGPARAFVRGIGHPLIAVRADHPDVLDPEHGRVDAAQRRPGRAHESGRDADREQMDEGAAAAATAPNAVPAAIPSAPPTPSGPVKDDLLAAEGRHHGLGAAPPQVTAGAVADAHRVVGVGQRGAVEVLGDRGVGARGYLRRALRIGSQAGRMTRTRHRPTK